MKHTIALSLLAILITIAGCAVVDTVRYTPKDIATATVSGDRAVTEAAVTAFRAEQPSLDTAKLCVVSVLAAAGYAKELKAKGQLTDADKNMLFKACSVGMAKVFDDKYKMDLYKTAKSVLKVEATEAEYAVGLLRAGIILLKQ